MLVDTLKAIVPKSVSRMIPTAIKAPLVGTPIPRESLRSFEYLQGLMACYQTRNLVNVGPLEFRERIDEFLNLRDYEMEGFKDPARQRDLSIQFHWAHDHDFGEFFIKGKLRTRHISLITTLIDWFPVLPKSLDGMRVLDIGCWTGGTSLLMCAMGAHVVAVEEVKKYIDCLSYLKYAFNLERLEPRNLSLYECTSPDLQDSFDFVLFAGVLYHVTDPILALRIPFNCLKDGGKCIIETAVTHTRKKVLAYEGPGVFGDGSQADLSRSGWNWFSPSPTTLEQMMADVGFTGIRLSKVIASSAGTRILALGVRDTHTDIMRGGLSVRTIR